MANKYADTLYKSMVRGLKQITNEDPTVKPCGMAAILVLLRRTDYSPKDNDNLVFIHRKSGKELRINPTQSYHSVIEKMAMLEVPYLLADDHNMTNQLAGILDRLEELRSRNDPALAIDVR